MEQNFQNLDLKEVIIKRNSEIIESEKKQQTDEVQTVATPKEILEAEHIKQLQQVQHIERLRDIQNIRGLLNVQPINKNVEESEIPQGIVGLLNLGNTCYMNSILQCLSNIEEFKNYICDQNIIKDLYPFIIKKIDDVNKSDYSVILSKTQLTITFQLYKLMSVIWSNKTKHVRPLNFRNVFANKIQNFRSFEQQDSQEALLCILDTIHEELRKPVEIDYKFCNETYLELFKKVETDKLSDIECCKMEDEYPNFWELLSVKRAIENYNKKSYSHITKIFQSLICSTLQCPTCNYHTYNFDPSNIITLPIPSVRDIDITKINEQMEQFAHLDSIRQEQVKQHLIMSQCNEQQYTLNDCFKCFVNVEKLDDNNKWLCPHCEVKVNAFKKTCVWIPPKIMIIHIKRFIQKQNNITGKYMINKMNNKIDYPTNGFILNPFMNQYSKKMNNYLYDLIGVSNHIGGLNGGHYYSFVKSLTDGKWYCLDDDRVSLLNELNVVSQNAYILIYKLRE